MGAGSDDPKADRRSFDTPRTDTHMQNSDILSFLNNRRSVKADLLEEPAPSPDALAELLQAAMSAPDHGAVRPWRFREIRGADRHALSDLFEKALRTKNPDVDPAEVETIRSKPLRAPLILAVGAEVTENHPKVPPLEQIVATACATQILLLAAESQGWGAILLTGWPAHDATVKKGLGFADKDTLIGFVYLGTPPSDRPGKTRPDAGRYLSPWPTP